MMAATLVGEALVDVDGVRGMGSDDSDDPVATPADAIELDGFLEGAARTPEGTDHAATSEAQGIRCSAAGSSEELRIGLRIDFSFVLLELAEPESSRLVGTDLPGPAALGSGGTP